VDVVAARLGLHGDVSGDRLAHFSVVLLECDLGFRYSVKIRIDDNDAQNRVLVVGAVQLEVGSAEVLAVDEKLLAALRVFRRRVAPSGQFLRARRHQLKLSEIAVQGWHVLDVSLVVLDGNVRLVGLQLRRFAGYFHGLARRADHELAIHALRTIGKNRNRALLKYLEARRLESDLIYIRDQVSHVEVAGLIGCGRNRRALGRAGYGYLRARNSRALRIG